MMLFRALILALMMQASALAMPVSNYQFEVLLNGDPVGTHSYRFIPEGEGYRMISDASYLVKIFFVPVYRYEHRSEEQWVNGCLQNINSETDDNGEEFQVNGVQAANDFQVQINNQPVRHPETCIRTFAYWQSELLDTTQLMNSQTGKLEENSFSQLEPSLPPWRNTEQGETDLPDTYRLETSQGEITLWYHQGRWLGLRSMLNSGHELLYRPVEDAAS